MENKQKVRKVSIRFKILIPVSILLIVVCAVMGFNSFRRMKKGLVDMGVEEAKMAANIAVSNIYGDYVAVVRPDADCSEEQAELLDSLIEMKDMCSMAYLYTLYSDDGKTLHYGVDSSDTKQNYSTGGEFESPYSEFADVFKGESYVQPYIDYTDDGTLISAYFPIYGTDGKIVGIMGSDYDATEIADSITKARNSIAILSTLCIVLSIIVVNLIITGVMRSLKKVDSKIYDLVYSEGDLTQKLDIHSGDEMELIAGNVNKLLEHIRSIMSNISKDSSQLDSSVGTVVDNIENARGDIADVSATMEELSAVMEEVSASLHEVKEEIDSIDIAIASIADKALYESRNSSQTSIKVVDIYNNAKGDKEDAARHAEEMSEAVNEKIKRSKAVENINALTMEIINITDQTNLLALNASIEAARAGEAGKGFAVVASEIGALAASSAEAAEKIQHVSQEVISAVDDLAKESEQMINFMNETAMSGYGKLLDNSKDYHDDVDHLSAVMNDFSKESEKLHKDINEIKSIVDTLNNAVQESALGLVDVTQAAINLADNMEHIDEEANSNMTVANQLKSEVDKFKL